MKLSKAQQDVVEKMRKGYALHYDYYTKAILQRGLYEKSNRIPVMESDYLHLKNCGLIVRCDEGWSTYHHIYCLSEQYKKK